MNFMTKRLAGFGVATATAALLVASAQAQNGPPPQANPSARAQAVVDFWTADKFEAATPRDLYLDHRGLAFRKGKTGFVPVGHGSSYELKAERLKPVPRAKPPGTGGGGGSSDTTPPTITGLSPADGAEFGTAQVFEATVTDAGGVKSVTFNITYTGGSQSFDGKQT